MAGVEVKKSSVERLPFSQSEGFIQVCWAVWLCLCICSDLLRNGVFWCVFSPDSLVIRRSCGRSQLPGRSVWGSWCCAPGHSVSSWIKWPLPSGKEGPGTLMTPTRSTTTAQISVCRNLGFAHLWSCGMVWVLEHASVMPVLFKIKIWAELWESMPTIKEYSNLSSSAVCFIYQRSGWSPTHSDVWWFSVIVCHGGIH